MTDWFIGRLFTEWFALCCQTVVCLSVLSFCDVGVLWPNGWMDQDETWLAGRPRPPWPHCVRWGPAPPPPKVHSPPPQFSANICCDQMAGWIKMPLGMEAGLDSGDCVRLGPSSPSPKRGQSPQFSVHVCCGQTAGCINMPLGMELGLAPGYIVRRKPIAPPPRERGTRRTCLLWPRSPISATAELLLKCVSV